MHTTPRQGSTMHQHSKTRLPAGCGSSKKATTTSGAPGAVTPSPALNTNGKKGGSMTILLAGDVDSMDPGYAYYALDYEIIYATQRPVYGYKANSNTVIPDLASAMPAISKDGKT